MDTEAVLDELGRLVDTVDSYLVYGDASIPFPAPTRIEAMKRGLEKARSSLFKIYTNLGGEDVWS